MLQVTAVGGGHFVCRARTEENFLRTEMDFLFIGFRLIKPIVDFSLPPFPLKLLLDNQPGKLL